MKEADFLEFIYVDDLVIHVHINFLFYVLPTTITLQGYERGVEAKVERETDEHLDIESTKQNNVAFQSLAFKGFLVSRDCKL